MEYKEICKTIRKKNRRKISEHIIKYNVKLVESEIDNIHRLTKSINDFQISHENTMVIEKMKIYNL